MDENNIDWTDIAYTTTALSTKNIVLAGHTSD